MEPWQWATAVLAGAVGQFLDTIAGMGFGVLTGSVMLAGGLSPAVVVGTVSVAKVGGGFASGLAHWGAGNVRRRWVAQVALPGMVGGAASAWLLTGLPVEVVRFWVPVVLIFMGTVLLRRFLLGLRPPISPAAGGSEAAISAPRPVGVRRSVFAVPFGAKLAVLGLVAGLINGISGAFGPVATTGLTLVTRGHPRYAIGSVNAAEFFVALSVSVTILARIEWAAIGWQLPLALMAGSLLTAPVGAYLTRRLPARVVGGLLAVVLVGLNGTTVIRALGS
jgi:uncharacterized membrane protein YfcA